MKTNLSTILICLTTVLISCGGIDSGNPISVDTTVSKYQVYFLFEHEGCKVFKFNDNGHIVYYTNCNGNMSWQVTRKQGKHTTTDHYNVPTSVTDSTK
jgi:hypothetical protein